MLKRILDIGIAIIGAIAIAAFVYFAVLPAPVDEVEKALEPSVSVKLAERGWDVEEIQLWETESGYAGTLKLKGGFLNRTVTRKITVSEGEREVKWETSPLGL